MELRAQPSTHSEELFWLGQQNETQTRQLRSSTLPNPTRDLPGMDISVAAVLGQLCGALSYVLTHLVPIWVQCREVLALASRQMEAPVGRGLPEAGTGEEGYLVLSTQPFGPSLAHICSEWLHHGTKTGLWGQMPHGPHTAVQQVACGPAWGVTIHSLPHRDPAERGGAPSKPACSSPPHLRETTDKLPLWLKLERDWGSLGDSIPTDCFSAMPQPCTFSSN